MSSRQVGRVLLGILAAALAVFPFALPAGGGQDEDAPPPDPATIASTLALYSGELFSVDFDDDGVPDITDSDGDGVPEVPRGEPGDRDITPENPLFLAPITQELESLGLNTVVSISDSSKLLYDCGGMAMSFAEDGAMVDWAIGIPSGEGGGPTGQLVDIFGEGDFGSRAFTKSNPFRFEHTVVYFGRLPGSGDGPMDHTWSIKTAGVSLDSGGDDNPQGNNRNAGEVSVDDIPGGSSLLPTGIFPIKGELTSVNGPRCTAEGWVEFATGNPLLNAASGVAALAGAAGVIGLLFNSRPAITWRG